MMRVLLTGGTGYIGSHTAVELLNENYEIIIVDNLTNSSIEVVDKIEMITSKQVIFYQIDILDELALSGVFENHEIDAVIHFAALKAVGESVENPLDYYINNVNGITTLLKVMKKHNVFKFVFSSSATVYGDSDKLPFTETSLLNATNPYGNTKIISEEIMNDLSETDKRWKMVSLRYFNPVGAHSSGEIGEKPNGIPDNLMPYIVQVANGQLDCLNVFGNDYDTPDGTGVRDYIHVVDLARGHLAALENIEELNSFEIFNLGTGKGHSVIEIIETFQKVNGVKIPYKIIERRQGDVAFSYADSTKAKLKLKWKTTKNINDMCQDVWNYVVISNEIKRGVKIVEKK